MREFPLKELDSPTVNHHNREPGNRIEQLSPCAGKNDLSGHLCWLDLDSNALENWVRTLPLLGTMPWARLVRLLLGSSALGMATSIVILRSSSPDAIPSLQSSLARFTACSQLYWR